MAVVVVSMDAVVCVSNGTATIIGIGAATAASMVVIAAMTVGTAMTMAMMIGMIMTVGWRGGWFLEEMGGKVVDGLLSLEFLWNFYGSETHDLFLYRS